MNEGSQNQWDQIKAPLREAGVAHRPEGEDLSAPHGFATRVLALHQANQRADATGLSVWRRRTLLGAACAVLLFGGCFLIEPKAPGKPLIPVPILDLELSNPNKR